MARTIRIRDLDDDVYDAVVRRAAEVGITVPEFLRREAAQLVGRPTVGAWLARTRRRPSHLSRAAVASTLDELRGPCPGAGD